MNESLNTYQMLREQRLQESSREFRARGKSVTRCERCQNELESACEFVVVLHRNEIFKPTNSGRLIADLLPRNTYMFIWDRTRPDARLLELLQDPARDCFIVFPGDGTSERKVVTELEPSSKRKTFILLDGTWKQSGRMFHLSRWFDALPCLSLPNELPRGYAVRKSHQEYYVSTLEAAGACLQMSGEETQAQNFFDYFSLFNLHYLATRGCYAPEITELHKHMNPGAQSR
jgi:DTW domain-containing protein YfiP